MERELRDLVARTSNVTINSHLHGRVRRAERGIDKRELQAAVKNGRKEAANPGRLGDLRWRYTLGGVVYITDETSRHEITSWRIDDASISVALAEGGPGGAHVVIVVDHSGSMRKPDVAGYATRTAAVYDCLARDFVQNQLAAGAADDVVVTVIEMADGASVAIHKSPLDQALANSLQARSTQRARSHGNYLPALDKALEVLQADASSCRTLMLLFLSDGEPSDHLERCCEHGVAVWKEDAGQQMLRRSGRSNLNMCFARRRPWECRKTVKLEVHKECLLRVLKIGDLLGRDRVVVGTVAFGGSDQDYAVLQQMGEALPRGSFQKLGLNAGGLRTAFSSLSSSLSVLHTDAGAAERTLRQKTVVKDTGSRSANGGGEEALLQMSEGWLMYEGRSAQKFRYSLGERKLVVAACAGQATGLAFYKHPFAQGVERFCYRCAEIRVPAALRARFDGADPAALREARRLVSKEAKHRENLGSSFQTAMARLQAEAAETARVFNRRVENVLGGVACAPLHLDFLEAVVWWCYDESYPNKEAWVLVEEELEGRFRKWNNNNGVVYSSSSRAAAVQAGGGAAAASVLGAICEDEDDEEEDDEEEEPDGTTGEVALDELPQVFSHFSHTYSSGKTLVCDLQGVCNAVDGFVLTDPVIHYVSSRRGSERHRNGGTDKGAQGVLAFFKTHRCGALCRRLGLAPPEMAMLLEEANTEVRACVVCMDRPRGTRFVPCRHASCCEECADELVRIGDKRCPICRCAFTSVIERGAQVAAQLTLA
jgi:hypothetical protein